MTRVLTAFVAALAMTSAWGKTPVGAQAGPATTFPAIERSPAPSPSPSPAPEPVCCRVPANTVIALEILDLLNSSQHKRGDKFRLRVITPVVVGGSTLIPAGSLGVGEIVHAAAARGGGAPGELLIAARSLNIDGQPAPLRGLKLGVTGGDNSAMALGVSFAAGAFAMFIRGREIEIPVGTQVSAKLAQDVAVAPTQVPPPTTPPSTLE